MAHALPADVMKLLFDEFQGEGTAIGPCRLVCKAWLPASRTRIFAVVDLKERSIQSFLDVVQTSSFPIKNFIRTLRLIVRQQDTFFQGAAENIKDLGPFPNATTLTVKANISIWIPTLADTFFPHNFPRLSNLNISLSDYTTMSMHDILAAITPFPTLESLKLNVNGQGFAFLDGSVPEVYRIPPRLHTLHFEMAMAPNFLELLFEMEDNDEIELPAFTTLSMQDSWPQERSFLGRYLRSFGHKMQHLRVDCSSDNMFDVPGALRYCTALRSLELHLDTSKVSGALLFIANYLDSPALTAIKVIDPDQRTGRSLSRHADKWQKLDQVLSEERFTGLDSLSFTFSRGLTERLREGMPLCAARGILRVLDA
ncbi:hypothetical protein B0H17DRAFT_317765 [Mycena rosella]|uniref:F-box domain-containing protein n=1 Tax=Mycena rosella TaxID=1033263 RepID=A0AAD7DTZ3_MYCRO|nr:hypothetical protein B0H17DRAFT_317765 [Mycena rosella]